MKRILSVILALTMVLTIVLPAFAAAPRAWNAEKKGFILSDGPEIVRLAEDSDEYGTWVYAYYRNTPELREIGDAFHAAVGNEDKLYGDLLGYNTDDIDGDLEVAVQVAYSFDGVNWVNDWEAGDGWVIITDFDRDGDDFKEYCYLPTKDQNEKEYYGEVKVFSGKDDCFSAQWCDPKSGMSIKQAITLRNNAMLQGRGEYLGSYQKDADDSGYGMAVDFNANTLYVKARYRVWNSLRIREDGQQVYSSEDVYYSNWGNIKTFNNDTAGPEAQDCVPDVSVLKSNVAPELKALSSWREKVTEDGVEITQTTYQLAVDYPAALDEALAKFRAYDWSRDRYIREEITGEWWDPQLVIEFRVNDGDWFFFESYDVSSPYFNFCDNAWWMRDKLEAVGFRPGDTVYLRARVYGGDSFYTGREDDGPDCDKVIEQENVRIRSGLSNVVELNLTGKYNVYYELDGGYFAFGTTQLTQFDDETDVTVDLTAADYTPSWRNHVFRGWFEDAAFTKPITSFNTALKMSRTYYAKWEELPYYTLSYDMGMVTGYIYNPNTERIYADDGEITLEDVSYEGLNFLGWFDAAEGGNRITALSYAAMTGNKTLYAHWGVPTYTITYDGAGTDYTNNTKNPATYQPDPSGQTVPMLYAPEKKGFIFDGWYFNKNLLNDALPYDEATGAYSMNRTGNVTVYAKWILGCWKINYVLNLDGVWNGANPDMHTYGTAVELNAPSRTGYTFGGWYKDEALTQQITVIPDDTEGEVTVYAKWTAIQYKINYDLRDENAANFFTNPNPVTRTVDDEVVLQPLVPLNDLYEFIGWYDNVNFDGEPVTTISAGTDRDVTLYAKIQKNLLGDVDGDGYITALDARSIYRGAVKLEDPRYWADSGDIDRDGSITAADARRVLRAAVGLESFGGTYAAYDSYAGNEVGFSAKTSAYDNTVTVTVFAENEPTFAASDFALYYDPDVLSCISYGGALEDEDSDDSMIAYNSSETGVIKAAIFNAETINAANKKTLLRFTFSLNDGVSAKTGIRLVTRSGRTDQWVYVCFHNYELTDRQAATCTEDGYEVYTCSICGDSYTTTLYAQHSYESEFTAPGCTTQGFKKYTCTVCGDTYIAYYTNAPGHVDTDGDNVCDVCGILLSDVPHTEHTFGAWTRVSAPTCTANGYEIRVCSGCSAFETRTVDATGHKDENGDNICDVCLSVLTIPEAPAHTEHTYGAWTRVSAPTCTANGYEIRLCTGCSAFETRTVDATGHKDADGNNICDVCLSALTVTELPTHTAHTFGAWTRVSAPTCTAAGYEIRVCTGCSAFETRTVNAAGHKDENGDNICDVCLSVLTIPETPAHTKHAFGEWTVVSFPTCTGNGVQIRVCTGCSAFETRTVNAAGHKDADNNGVCDVCLSVLTIPETPAHTEHTFSAWTVTSNPTCTQSGRQIRVCAVCGETETETLPALGHDFSEWVNITPASADGPAETVRTCRLCGLTEHKTVEELKPVVTALNIGDVDEDGKVTASDARTVLRTAVKLETLDAWKTSLADADRNNAITSADARLVLRASVNLENRADWLK